MKELHSFDCWDRLSGTALPYQLVHRERYDVCVFYKHLQSENGQEQWTGDARSRLRDTLPERDEMSDEQTDYNQVLNKVYSRRIPRILDGWEARGFRSAVSFSSVGALFSFDGGVAKRWSGL